MRNVHSGNLVIHALQAGHDVEHSRREQHDEETRKDAKHQREDDLDRRLHGLLLGARPHVVTPAQWLVTLASLPLCVVAGWVLTRLIEEPITAYGRTWTWSGVERRTRAVTAVEPTPKQI